ncbi:DExH-box splicing factor binding site-domain-containing protein [Delphinella strobiligena]|nr:DExH-box splicing factor binding site-domain-containing protein [Delphinella strobiligena]
MASFSISLGGGSKPRKPSPPPSKIGIKRTHAALDDADSEDEDISAGKRQNITHFDLSAGGAVDVSKPKVVKEALVIKPQANRDWKAASLRNKRQKYGLPSEEQQKAKEDFVAPKPTTFYGLNVHKEEPANGDVPGEAQDQSPSKSAEHVPAKPKTDDERAIAALMGLKEESTLTIPAISEEEALERDIQEAPDAPTLAEYAATPVEEFGAAMLRGMGWKEGQGIGTQKGQKLVKSKVPERRPALLGVGAKPDAAVAAELGAWGAGAKGKRRTDIVYNPLVLKNSKTGEQLTEEELKAKLQDQKEREMNEKHSRESERDYERRDKSSRPSRRHRDDDYYLDDREERHKERRREKDYEDGRRRLRRDTSASADKHRSRRDRSSSYDRVREKRRDRDHDKKYDDRRVKDRQRRDRDDHDRRDGRHHYDNEQDRQQRR